MLGLLWGKKLSYGFWVQDSQCLLQFISVNRIKMTLVREIYMGLGSSGDQARWPSSNCCNAVSLVEKNAILIEFLPLDAGLVSACLR